MMNSLEKRDRPASADRSYSGVRLSETGKTLMPKIHRLLQVYDALNGEINALQVAQQATHCAWRRWIPSLPAGCPGLWRR